MKKRRLCRTYEESSCAAPNLTSRPRARTSGEEGGLEDMVKVDLDNSRWLAGVLDDNGWPSRTLVGDCQAAFPGIDYGIGLRPPEPPPVSG